VCNRDTKKIRMAALPALILALFPLTSRADVGSLAGVVLIAFWIALAIWSALTLGVFLLLRRRTVFTRFAATALFFFAPVLLVAGMWFGEELQYEHYVQARENIGVPLAVPGAVEQVTPCALQVLCKPVQ
jgi:uncharacterized membrane protein